ncbi:MAG: hypothetical protein F4213_11090 [Boseongicola sp. SB0677_bin_26]|nr:hypothetical protein [Boseongicola sp. SB0665_bin_10]MYG26552.1 hypothetical protein [Boseongicola sp. SB0677_bin_26]
MTVTAKRITDWLAASGLGLDTRLLGGWGTRASKPRGSTFARVLPRRWALSRSGVCQVSARDASRE